MNVLIPFINKLGDIQGILGSDEPLLPHVVVVGAQGSAKSCVIESLVGQTFLPHGEGLSTRCPVIIHLKHTEGRSSVKFNHLPDKIFTDWDEVQKEVKGEMDRTCGKNFGISTKPILMEIQNKSVADLTVIDLPGLTEVAIGQQAPDISIQMKKLSLRYMRTPGTVIMAVVPATTDMSTNEVLMLCRLADPSGSRTIVVMTKLDLAGPGVDLTPSLTGQDVKGFRKIVGVVTRSHQCHKEKKKMDDVLKREKKFLHSKYPWVAQEHGTPVLRMTLVRMLRDHLLLHLPELRRAVSGAVYRAETETEALGGNQPGNSGKIVLEAITRFASTYCGLLAGSTPEIELKFLVGGARISYIFQEIFGSTLERVDPLSGLSRTQILTALRNTAGTRPDVLFIPETCFENLARRQVELLLAHCRRCVELVYEEMVGMTKEICASAVSARYPKLYDAICNLTVELIERRHRVSAELVEDLLEMELGFINTLDPDFQRDLDASKVTWLVTRGLQLPSADEQVNERQEKSTCQQNNRQSESSGWLSALLSRRGDDEGDATASVTTPTAPPSHPPPDVGYVRMSAKEDADCQLVENLIGSYVSAVKRSLKDGVPKAIMLRLVNYVQMHLYHTLLDQLQHQKTNLDQLLTEPESVVLHRTQLTASLKALKQAECDLLIIQDNLRNIA